MLRYCATLFASLLLFGGTSHAIIILQADLTNDQENPPALPLLTGAGSPRPVSFGTATFELDDAMTAMTFSATIFNIDFTGTQTPDINDNLVAAHIHASATPGTNAPVVWGFFGSPLNDNNPNDVVVVPFATGVGGSVSGKWDPPEGNGTNLAAQLPFILGGLSYINFHTAQFPGGEVRGQITVASLPEPSTILLLSLGALGLGHRQTKKPASSGASPRMKLPSSVKLSGPFSSMLTGALSARAGRRASLAS